MIYNTIPPPPLSESSAPRLPGAGNLHLGSSCTGCGVCTHTCPEETMKLKRVERSEPFPGPGDLYRTVARENKGIEA